MKRTTQRITAACALAGVALLSTAAQSASAAVDPKNPCNISGWYVNADEAPPAPDRRPDRTLAGFVFEGNDLIHHSANVPLAFLKPGWFNASPAPDQSSFFSVEVRDPTTNAYGTLRWNSATALWQITIGEGTGPAGPATHGTFSGADPVALLKDKVTKWGKFTSATRVVSFGVGYTNDPSGKVKTVVTSVTFMNKPFYFNCLKEVDPSPTTTTTPSSSPTSPSPSATSTASPSASATSSSPSPSSTRSPSSPSPSASSATTSPAVVPAPDDDESLPVTGSSGLPLLIGGALIALLAGIAAVVASQYRKRKGTTIDRTRDDGDEGDGPTGTTYYKGGVIR